MTSTSVVTTSPWPISPNTIAEEFVKVSFSFDVDCEQEQQEETKPGESRNSAAYER